MVAAGNPDVILKTTVTWKDFEGQLRSALSTGAKLGPNKSVLDIGDGTGFVSCCALITCDWIGVSGDEKLPNKVVLKIPSILPLRRLNDSLPEGQRFFDYDDAQWDEAGKKVYEIHNTEVSLYDFMGEFEGLPMPRKYFGSVVPAEEPGDRLLCIEYVDNTKVMNFYKEHSVDQVKQIARALGKIQACSLKKEPIAKELHKDFFKNMIRDWPLEKFQGTFKGITTVDNSERTRELMEKIEALVPVYYGSNLPTTIHRQMGFRPVLVNGDLHTSNVLIDKDTNDLAALIDWQATHLGVGVEDLHRISISSLTAKDRREAWPMLVKTMYESLVENLAGVEPPNTLEKLLQISDLIFPQCAILAVGQFTSAITRRNRDATLTEDEVAARKGIMLGKILGALEDVVALDIKNKKHMKNLKLVI